MKPKKLKLRGFIGIRSGLGRDEITVDLETLVGAAQLVALTGANGKGKTTVLDNLHPYRLMPSRANGYSTSAFSYYDHISNEALKELEWEHNGRRYRSTLVFKQTPKTKKAEAYLHTRAGTGWEPVTLPDGMVSDGKTASYDRCVEHVLGTPEMFFTAAFAAQGRKPLSSYTNGDVRGLLSELLGLSRVQELGAKSAEVVKLLRARFDGMRDDLSRVETKTEERTHAAADLATAETEITQKGEERQSARNTLHLATRRLSEVQAEANTNVDADIRRNTLEGQLRAAQARLTAAVCAADSDIDTERQRHAKAVAAYTREAERLRGQVTTLQQQVARSETLMGRKAEIDQAVAQGPALATIAEEADAAVARARVAVENFQGLESRRAAIDGSLKAIAADGRNLVTTCEALKTQARLSEEVPCQGTDLQGRCKLLADAWEAKEKVPEVEVQASAKREEYRNQNAILEGVIKEMTPFQGAALTLRAADEAARIAHRRVQDNSALAAQATALAQAQQTIEAATEQIRALETELAAKKADADAAGAAHAQRQQELEARKTEARSATETETRIIQSELALLPPPADTSALEAAQQAVEDAERAYNQAEQAVQQINTRIATLRERIRTLDKDLAGATEVKRRAGVLETEIAHWSLLAKALGNDGIIALSIDDAGPTLSSLTNDLLLSCYGPRFTVRLDTQRETQDGNLKESFDIVVFDAERDDEKSVRTMSGGEKIWINECLTRAMALYQAQLSGQQYGCLFADESDGALDPARKQMFMAMKRRVLELGGYEREFFISHTPELWDLADARINMEQFATAAPIFEEEAA